MFLPSVESRNQHMGIIVQAHTLRLHSRTAAETVFFFKVSHIHVISSFCASSRLFRRVCSALRRRPWLYEKFMFQMLCVPTVVRRMQKCGNAKIPLSARLLVSYVQAGHNDGVAPSAVLVYLLLSNVVGYMTGRSINDNSVGSRSLENKHTCPRRVVCSECRGSDSSEGLCSSPNMRKIALACGSSRAMLTGGSSSTSEQSQPLREKLAMVCGGLKAIFFFLLCWDIFERVRGRHTEWTSPKAAIQMADSGYRIPYPKFPRLEPLIGMQNEDLSIHESRHLTNVGADMVISAPTLVDGAKNEQPRFFASTRTLVVVGANYQGTTTLLSGEPKNFSYERFFGSHENKDVIVFRKR